MFVKNRRVWALLLAVSIIIVFPVTGWSQVTKERADKDAEVNDSRTEATSEEKALGKETGEAVAEKIETLKSVLQGNQPIDGITALAILGIGSFFVDRISTFALKFLAMFAPWRKLFPAPESIPDDQPQLQSKARSKLVVVYYLFAGLVAIGLIAHYGHVRLFSAVGFGDIDPRLDQILTGLTMVIGSERVAQWLNLPGTPGVMKADPQPISIFGELSLLEASRILEEATKTEAGEDDRTEAT